MKLPEIAWGYPEVFTILAWKLAPFGFVMSMSDLTTLPFDRVLVEDRKPDKLTLSFLGVKKAKALMRPERGTERATISELQGKYLKYVTCTLWHFARRHQLGKTDSVVLTEYDRQCVPGDHQLMAAGHAQGVEWRFTPNAEAVKLAAWYKEHEDPAAFVTEKTQL